MPGGNTLGDEGPGSGVRCYPCPASSLHRVASGSFLNLSVLHFPSLEVRMMNTALSAMASVGLHEILMVMLFAQGLVHGGDGT